MIVTCVHVHVTKENINDFIAATVKNHNASINEPGNIRFDFVQSVENECRFMLYEAYISEEAAAAHKETPHYKEWRGTVENWMAEPRKGIKYKFIAPKF
ncbi:MAG: antibiotic biosynthesis monooxygenase [Bacteroidia bacterium]|nr:antibiotic biosynthesis monooxygenase [Bacteroidia bacterium]